MGSKVMLALVMFMAAILLISAEVAPNEYENFNTKHGKAGSNGIHENKGYWGGPYGGWGSPYYGGGWGGGWGGPYRGGWGGPYRGGWGGPWRGGWGWGGGWRPNEHVQAGINANPHN